MKVKNLIPAVLLALALSATFALADYDFEGEGSGQCGSYYPWVQWLGTLYPVSNPYFNGYWWHGSYGDPDHDGTIIGENGSLHANGCYYFSGDENCTWDCEQDVNLNGYWQGAFCPGSDTASGTWWKHDNTCNGTFGGNLAD